MTICLFQGTFNPPHNGHLQVAKFVLQTCNFDRIIFIPAAKPPHKTLNENEALHRLNMTKLLVKDYPCLYVSDIEFQRKTLSYTYITIQELYKKENLTEKPYFIIGDDAFLKIESWYHSSELKDLINFIVLPRDNDYDEKKYKELKEKGYNYKRLNMPEIDISSTQIRELCQKRLPLNNLTSKEVEKYIYEHNLYRNVD